MPVTAAADRPLDTSAPLTDTSAASWVRVTAGSALAFLIVALLQASANYTDQLRRGTDTTFDAVIGNSLRGWWPWAGFTAVLYVVLSRRAQQLGDRAAMARLFFLAFVYFFVPQVAYQVLLVVLDAPPESRSFLRTLQRWPANFWLIDFAIFVSALTVVYAMVAARERAAAHRRRQQLDAENLELRLELEQQRVVVLRAQLEPHFLFNALNAISGLVRGADKSLALSALTRLSELLRYVLTASSRDWVTVGEELQFVRGYAMLQQLRYGPRLQLTITGDDDTIRSGDCPPLLLQPLVENAIRHDLESHEGASDIRMTLALVGERLTVLVSNPIHPAATPNAGLGLGLRSTRERLALLYGSDASFRAGTEDGRFVVHLDLPLQAP